MKKISYRKIFAALMAIPLIVSSVMLWQAGDAAELWSSGTVFGLSLLLIAMLMIPGRSAARRMRQRETVEPTLMPRVRMQ